MRLQPDGRSLLVAGIGFMEIWGPATGRALVPRKTPFTGTMPANFIAVVRTVFSPDGSRFVAWNRNWKPNPSAALVYVTATGEPLGPPLQHRASITDACFSPDGTRILTASEDQTARVWDAATGRPLLPPLVHRAPLRWAAFSPDGRLFCTSTSLEARLWETATGDPVGPALALPLGGDASFAWSPNSRQLVTMAGKVGLRLWDLSPGDRPVAELKALARLLSSHELPRDGAAGFTPLGAAELRALWQEAETLNTKH